MYEELVKRIRGCSCSDPNGCEECRNCPNAENYYECKQKLALQAADAIEELSMKLHGDEATIAGMKREIERMVVAGKPRWIPVTERLPEEFQPIWVACKMDGRENWTFDTIYDPYLKCPWGPYYYLEKGEAVVYAWMDRSAPEPPKEEA